MTLLQDNTSYILELNTSNILPSSSPSSLNAEYQNIENVSTYIFDLGPKRDPLSSVIPITVIYVVILITGLIGNICTCVVITRNKHMRTVTNYYLFSLAISDLLLLVFGLPQELYLLWNKYPYVFGEAFCIIRGFTSEMSTYASILTITLFTLERYFAICHPLKTHTMSKHSRAVYMIIGVWIISCFSAVHVVVQIGIVYQYFNGEMISDTAECTLKNSLRHAFLGSTLAFFIVPMIIISALYIRIGVQLRTSESVNRNRSETHFDQVNAVTVAEDKTIPLKKIHLRKLLTRHSTRTLRGHATNSRKAVIKMLFAVVVGFFLCWAPFHAQRLMAIYVKKPTPTVIMMYTTLTHISGVTYYVSATINPILYSIMSNKFRQAFKNTLAHCCRKEDLYSASIKYSNYSTVIQRSTSNGNSVRRKKQTPESKEYRNCISPLANGIDAGVENGKT